MPSTTNFWLGRQPILDTTGNTVAYELLFRTGGQAAGVTDHCTATASVISHAFNDLGTASVLGHCRGFINFDTELLLSDVVELLPPDITVIELLETVEITPDVVQRCRDLRALGFSFALDDVVHLDEAKAEILPLVDVVKIDVRATPVEQLPALIERVRQLRRVKLLAEKVEDQAQAEHCKRLGFDLFQGYFFARPVTMTGRRADPSKRLLMHLLQQCLRDEENLEIETTFKRAPELTYKLMRLVNSVGMGLQSPIRSLAHALVVVGRRQLQRWLQVLLFACDGTGDFPSPLLQMAAARGRLLELLAERRSRDTGFADRAFMTGILSLLDTLFEMPMAAALAQMSLPDDVTAALRERTGALGRMLDIACALEDADDSRVATLLADGDPCSTAELAQLQIAALSWSNALGQLQR